MLTLYIRNVSGLKPISNYKYAVMVNAEKIAEGMVKGHFREDGWAKLVSLIAEEAEEHDSRSETIGKKTGKSNGKVTAGE